jgi:hypothetical protein
MGIPLKWCDGKEFGEMFPHGDSVFSTACYPNVSDEIKALQSIVATLNLNDFKTMIKCSTDTGTVGT